jgi:hypothetical protein
MGQNRYYFATQSEGFTHSQLEKIFVLLPTPLAQDQALRALAEIRAVIDRSTRYSTFSALSGFIAAGAALIGSGLCGAFPFVGTRPEEGLRFVAVWSAVLVIAGLAQFILTAIKARQRGEALWTPIARTAFASLLGPGIAGVAGSVVLIQTGRFDMLPGLWLLLYGCGLWAVSFFAPLFLRVLGMAFMILGLCAWLSVDQSALWLGLGFGGLHLVFGGVVLARYRQ